MHPNAHGHYKLKRALNTLGRRGIDRRSRFGKAIMQWRSSLRQDLGGDVSTQQETVIDLAVKTKVLLDSIDAWIFRQKHLVTKKRALIPVVRERMLLADSLARYMGQLGLERKVKDIPSLRDYIEEATSEGVS